MANAPTANPAKDEMAPRDAFLVSLMAMTGCCPGEALALRWSNLGAQVSIAQALSGDEIADRTKTGEKRLAPIRGPLRGDLTALRDLAGDGPDDFVVRLPAGIGAKPTGGRSSEPGPSCGMVMIPAPAAG